MQNWDCGICHNQRYTFKRVCISVEFMGMFIAASSQFFMRLRMSGMVPKTLQHVCGMALGSPSQTSEQNMVTPKTE